MRAELIAIVVAAIALLSVLVPMLRSIRKDVANVGEKLNTEAKDIRKELSTEGPESQSAAAFFRSGRGARSREPCRASATGRVLRRWGSACPVPSCGSS